ncbi:uncharacterized protein LOC141674582 [Apium graveolens]|uniref:uncharacterized protein LOC141674582 n=1 Tax=Apium graveolens TaxID=4045 RepID=UPI003D7B8E40
MAKYLRVVKGILTQFDEWYAKHIPREGNTTADPIKIHLKTGWFPDGAQEARKLSVRALRYLPIEVFRYKRSLIIPYLKCLRPLEAEETLKEAHEGIWIAPGGRALAHNITQLGFYWPTMLADAKAYVKKCIRWQKHASIVRQSLERLTSINTPIPFVMWGMDILGQFPVVSG